MATVRILVTVTLVGWIYIGGPVSQSSESVVSGSEPWDNRSRGLRGLLVEPQATRADGPSEPGGIGLDQFELTWNYDGQWREHLQQEGLHYCGRWQVNDAGNV